MSQRVRFLEQFEWVPPDNRRASVVYREGHQGRVKQDCADKAIALGKAFALTTAAGIAAAAVEATTEMEPSDGDGAAR